MEETLDDEVWACFNGGMPASEIDAELHLARGTAHDTIVAHWRWDKENGRPAARIREGE